MKPGRELDALIAEKVMGIPISEFNFLWDKWASGASMLSNSYHYSTDIAAAWEVVEKLRKLEHWNGGKLVVNIRQQDTLCEGQWVVEVSPTFRPTHTLQPMGFSDSAPHAICLAALKAGGAL